MKALSFPHRTFVVALLIITAFPLLAQEPEFTTVIKTDPDDAPFVYDDILNFVKAHALLAERSDTLEVLKTEYLDKGTPGLRMFIEKYDLTPERLARAIARHPEDYAALDDMAERLQRQEPNIRKAFGKMKELIPDIVYPPTYYLVGAWRGIGSGSVEGQLITVEKEAANRSKKHDETALLVHELTHFQQGKAIGYRKYVALFSEEKSLLGLTIREGTAEFVAKRVAGRYTQDEAEAFVTKNEKRLWEEFQPVMLGQETGDWMWRKPKDPEQPYHVAYVMGARIVAAYYKNAEDKAKAMQEILSVTEYENFLKKSGYDSILRQWSD